MAKQQFNKTIPHYCMYCQHGTTLGFTDEIICNKHGVMNKFDTCRKYTYDPIKRIPSKDSRETSFSEKDFSIY